MSDTVVTFSKAGAVGYITLDRPPANSYEINFMHDLDAAIEAANGDEAVKVVIFKKALEMMITGQRIGPEEAHRLGLVNKLFPAEKLLEETEAYAQKLTTGATLAIGAIKRCVYDGIQMKLHDALAYERQLIAHLFDSEDAKEGFAAFAAKRPPQYRGK